MLIVKNKFYYIMNFEPTLTYINRLMRYSKNNILTAYFWNAEEICEIFLD